MKSKFTFVLMAVAIYSSMSFVCPRDGIFPHPSDCNKFFICTKGVAYEQRCAEGLAFNPAILACDWADNVKCEGIKRYTEKQPCKCKNESVGYKLYCELGADRTNALCVQDSPCYGSNRPDDICD